MSDVPSLLEQTDFLVDADASGGLAYAGLVLEMLGWTRWRRGGHVKESRSKAPHAVYIASTSSSRLADEQPNRPRALLELSDGDWDVELPLTFDLHSSIHQKVHPAIGLYTRLDGVGSAGSPDRREDCD